MNINYQTAPLSDHILLERLVTLAQKENEATVEFLLHLGEVDHRKLYAGAGCSSMYDYLTRKLLYSEPAASRRIACARAVREFPALAGELLSRALSLTTLSMVAGLLNVENFETLLQSVRGRSRREVEEVMAGLRPRTSAPREELKPLALSSPSGYFAALEEKLSMKSTLAGDGNGRTGLLPQRDLSMPEPVGTAQAPAEPERRYQVKFTISKETHRKLEQARALLSGKYPCGVKLEDVFEEALEQLLERRSPERRLARRTEAARRREQRGEASAAPPDAKGRHIPAAVRDEVLVRDEGRCSYVSPDGVRCGTRVDPELHHIHPAARGGASSAHNLICLCRTHNLFEARRAYGEAFMAGKIANVTLPAPRPLRHDAASTAP